MVDFPATPCVPGTVDPELLDLRWNGTPVLPGRWLEDSLSMSHWSLSIRHHPPGQRLVFFTRHCWASCPTCKPVAAQTNLKPEETAEKPDFPLDFFWEIVVQIIVLGLWNYVSRWTIGGPSVRSTGTANSNVTFGYWSHRLQPANTKRPNFGSPENWGAWSEPWNWSTNWSGKTQTKTLYTKNPKFTPRISWIRTKINHVYGDNLII